eukprot:COSAG06_NODE_5962_length_3182_cov_11.158936_5_plen_103_part_00
MWSLWQRATHQHDPAARRRRGCRGPPSVKPASRGWLDPDVLLNGKPAVAGGALPSVSGHDGRGFGLLVLPPQSVSFVRLGLIPNCQQCELWQGEGGNSSCIP